MATRTPPPEAPTHEPPIRKRVCKACDRCRQKKSKCDGELNCARCRAENVPCEYGKNKKATDKTHPKGYTESLERQQRQLVKGLQALYHIIDKGERFPGGPLETPVAGGHPYTHDILTRLGAMNLDEDDDEEQFEEDFNELDQKLAKKEQEEKETTEMKRQDSAGSFGSAHSQQSAHAPAYFPPTPPSAQMHHEPLHFASQHRTLPGYLHQNDFECRQMEQQQHNQPQQHAQPRPGNHGQKRKLEVPKARQKHPEPPRGMGASDAQQQHQRIPGTIVLKAPPPPQQPHGMGFQNAQQQQQHQQPHEIGLQNIPQVHQQLHEVGLQNIQYGHPQQPTMGLASLEPSSPAFAHPQMFFNTPMNPSTNDSVPQGQQHWAPSLGILGDWTNSVPGQGPQLFNNSQDAQMLEGVQIQTDLFSNIDDDDSMPFPNPDWDAPGTMEYYIERNSVKI
ncbi:hypothetical protein FQN55_001456 [Onygenales sp. PD_40]|nr:hypothetical protein FQN55_001456 [Onygenales sp. PD_40]